MRGDILPLPQCAFTVWCSVRAQGQIYLYLYFYLISYNFNILMWYFMLFGFRVLRRLWGVWSECNKMKHRPVTCNALKSVRWVISAMWGQNCRRALLQHMHLVYIAPVAKLHVDIPMLWTLVNDFRENMWAACQWSHVLLVILKPLCLTKHHDTKTSWGSGDMVPRAFNLGAR
jgi:hypothetical protein